MLQCWAGDALGTSNHCASVKVNEVQRAANCQVIACLKTQLAPLPYLLEHPGCLFTPNRSLHITHNLSHTNLALNACSPCQHGSQQYPHSQEPFNAMRCALSTVRDDLWVAEVGQLLALAL